jgi:hypothetical protein
VLTLAIAAVTLDCPGSSNASMTPVQARWWPLAPNGIPTPATTKGGVLDATHSNDVGSGTMFLVRQ